METYKHPGTETSAISFVTMFDLIILSIIFLLPTSSSRSTSHVPYTFLNPAFLSNFSAFHGVNQFIAGASVYPTRLGFFFTAKFIILTFSLCGYQLKKGKNLISPCLGHIADAVEK